MAALDLKEIGRPAVLDQAAAVNDEHTVHPQNRFESVRNGKNGAIRKLGSARKNHSRVDE